MSSPPHDGIFKSAFARADIARGALACMLPKAVVRELDLASLEVCSGSFVDEALRHAHSDLLYRVRTARGGEAFVYVVAEHQSSFDPTMPLRLLRYVMRVWEQWLVDHPKASKVPIVLPLVIHNGPAGWRAAPSLRSMLDGDDALLEASREFVPHFRFVLDDLTVLGPEELFARAVPAMGRLALLALWSARSRARLQQIAPVFRALALTEERSERTRMMMRQLYVYLLRAAEPDVDVEEVRAILMGIAGPEGYEDVMNAGEQLIEKGRTEGRAEGLSLARAMIVKVLAVRNVVLSELAQARLGACTDMATLEQWATRALTAVRETDVFGESA